MVERHHRFNGHEFEQIWEIVKERKLGVLYLMGVSKSQT